MFLYEPCLRSPCPCGYHFRGSVVVVTVSSSLLSGYFPFFMTVLFPSLPWSLPLLLSQVFCALYPSQLSFFFFLVIVIYIVVVEAVQRSSVTLLFPSLLIILDVICYRVLFFVLPATLFWPQIILSLLLILL